MRGFFIQVIVTSLSIVCCYVGQVIMTSLNIVYCCVGQVIMTTQHRVLWCWSGDRAARPGGQEPVARPGGDTDGGSDEDPAHLHHGPTRNDQPGAIPW